MADSGVGMTVPPTVNVGTVLVKTYTQGITTSARRTKAEYQITVNFELSGRIGDIVDRILSRLPGVGGTTITVIGERRINLIEPSVLPDDAIAILQHRAQTEKSAIGQLLSKVVKLIKELMEERTSEAYVADMNTRFPYYSIFGGTLTQQEVSLAHRVKT